MHPLVAGLRGGLIVSCQPKPDSPFKSASAMALFARAAEIGGARAIRADGPADVRAIRRAVGIPIIGINKVRYPSSPVYITPTLRSALSVVRAGASLLACDATARLRPRGIDVPAFVRALLDEFGLPVMADVATVDEGLAAAAAGAQLVATTMAGYTDARPATAGPDLDLVAALAERCQAPIVCEGRISSPADVRAAFAAGAFAVVVGTAITNPTAVVRMYVGAAGEMSEGDEI